MWLLDHRDWRYNTARTAAWAVDRWHRSAHGTSLVGDAVTAYLARLGKRSPSPLPLTEPLRGADVVAVSEQLHALDAHPGTGQEMVVALRDGLTAMRLFAANCSTLREGFDALQALSLEVHADTSFLVAGGTEVIAEASPERAALWSQHLSLLRDRRRVCQRASTAAHRSGLTLDNRIGDLSEEQWEWLWRMMDGTTTRRLRDHAYLLLGFEHARRHAELRRLDIEDVTPADDGLLVTYRRTKNGDDWVGALAHDGSGGTCSAYCAACAVSDLLRWEQLCMRRPDGPLLATRYGGAVRRMTRQNGRLRIRHLTRSVSDVPWGSTRSLRAGAATTAWESGWSVEMIARHLTGHRDVNEAAQYVRRHGAAGGTLQLRLTASED